MIQLLHILINARNASIKAFKNEVLTFYILISFSFTLFNIFNSLTFEQFQFPYEKNFEHIQETCSPFIVGALGSLLAIFLLDKLTIHLQFIISQLMIILNILIVLPILSKYVDNYLSLILSMHSFASNYFDLVSIIWVVELFKNNYRTRLQLLYFAVSLGLCLIYNYVPSITSLILSFSNSIVSFIPYLIIIFIELVICFNLFIRYLKKKNSTNTKDNLDEIRNKKKIPIYYQILFILIVSIILNILLLTQRRSLVLLDDYVNHKHVQFFESNSDKIIFDLNTCYLAFHLSSAFGKIILIYLSRFMSNQKIISINFILAIAGISLLGFSISNLIVQFIILIKEQMIDFNRYLSIIYFIKNILIVLNPLIINFLTPYNFIDIFEVNQFFIIFSLIIFTILILIDKFRLKPIKYKDLNNDTICNDTSNYSELINIENI